MNPKGEKFEGEWHMDKPKRRCPLPDDVKRFIAETQVRNGKFEEKKAARNRKKTTKGSSCRTSKLSAPHLSALIPLFLFNVPLFKVYGELPARSNSMTASMRAKNISKSAKVVATTGNLDIYGETPYGELVYDRTDSEIYDTVNISATGSVRNKSDSKVSGLPPPPIAGMGSMRKQSRPVCFLDSHLAGSSKCHLSNCIASLYCPLSGLMLVSSLLVFFPVLTLPRFPAIFFYDPYPSASSHKTEDTSYFDVAPPQVCKKM